MAQHLYEATHIVIGNLPPRTQEVMLRRFGIAKGKRETLESVGRSYDITRERVRQIESFALKQLRDAGDASELAPYISKLEEFMRSRGGVMAEHHVLAHFATTCLHDDTKHPHVQGCVLLLLNVGPQFDRQRGTDDVHPHWVVDKQKVAFMHEVLEAIRTHLVHKQSVQQLAHIVDAIEHDLYPDIVDAYINVSKYIGKNQFDHYGLSDWPEITPKGMRDKAYLVLKHVKKPLHFTAVATSINEMGLSKRPALSQTVHNELIKDPRFVLVGRGMYALSEWGYQPGTVKDVIVDVLKQGGKPLTREEILKTVLTKRHVKPNTILLNLHNRKEFKRTGDGRYALAS